MGKEAQTFHHSIPFVAHKRLTVVTPPVHTVRVRPSVILAEIDRINRKVRPSLAYQPAEDYLNSRSAVYEVLESLQHILKNVAVHLSTLGRKLVNGTRRSTYSLISVALALDADCTLTNIMRSLQCVPIAKRNSSFDDETRSIRAQTAALLKRIHEPLPRATKTFPISVTRYQEPPIPERITSDAYIHRLLGPTHNVKQEILSMSHYDEPAKRLMGDNAGEMSPESSTESYPAFADIGLSENPGKNFNQDWVDQLRISGGGDVDDDDDDDDYDYDHDDDDDYNMNY
ncbi:hypothetical protein ANN_23811 [Periplaneta americana]|uniref:Uncharacterized protein n=1 Tax=Periplaneta americana TaxID=6978 RepID=A0ABQ8SMK3_PERAM|nr:hypothetical protein ANN_23811 [Periplaneta americana]